VAFSAKEAKVASLALMVTFIFMAAVLLGPAAMMLNRLGFKKAAVFVAVLAVLVGGYWALVAPFPISLAGGASAIIGLMTINRY
jgi:hypothetical protein